MAKEKFEQSKFEAPEEKADLTTAEGRQKEIEKIFKEGEEIKSEKSEAQLLEAINKQDKKIDAEIKEKPFWIREKIEKAAGWYKKQPLWKKIVFSVGCVGAASASAAVGGAVGTAVATAAFTGSMSQRLLGGLATFVTAEGLLKKAAEKGGRERTKAETIRHTIEAATLGILVGSGSAARAVREISEATGVTDILRESYRFWFPSGVQAPEIVSPKPGVKEALLQPEAPAVPEPEIKPETLIIGERGPEGAIIDYFKNNLDIAKKFGWDGEVDLDKWTGTKAHQLWLEDAKEALEKPEILDKLEKLGYSRDIEGYAQMMRRIGEGGVEINPEIGKIELVDTEYLKARISAETPSPETPSPEAPLPEAPAKHIPEKLGDFENYNLLEQDRTLNLLDNNINDIKNNLSKFTAPDSIGKIKGEISRLEDLRGSMLKNPAFLENQTTMRTYLIFLERETGLNLDEYGAIKNVKAGEFLEEISKYKESGEWPDLPSHGSYGAMELKRQVGLAQILDSDQWKGIDKDLTIEDAIKSKIMTVAETGVGQTGKTLDSSVFEQVGGKTLVEAGILDNIIQDKFISDAEINQVWNNLKSNKLTLDDFISYYSYKLNESGIKLENDSVLRKGFKEVFNNYIKETDPALKSRIEIGKIKPALKILLNRLAKQ